MQDYSEFKAGYVSLIGKPNAGKSTLVNQLLNLKLSIVTRKPQTTRKKVVGVLNGDNFQIIFTDTPGMIEPKYNLQKVMMNYVQSAVKDADILVYLVDLSGGRRDLTGIDKIVLPIQKPIILALNKTDLVDKKKILQLIDAYRKIYSFQAIVPISSLKNKGVDNLLQEIKKTLPFSPPYYPMDYFTIHQERFFVAEIIREKIFLFFGEEIPYSTHVEVDEFKERSRGKTYIRALIFTEKTSQKGILIGKKGSALKRIGETARKDIELFLEKPVFLELYVKVMEGWRKKEKQLKQLGY